VEYPLNSAVCRGGDHDDAGFDTDIARARARQEARERPTVALRLLVLLAVMVAVIIAASVGAAPPAPAAGIRAAVILLIAALTIVWARG